MNAKRTMLSPVAMIVQTVIIFGVLLLFSTLLNRWSLAAGRGSGAGDRGQLRTVADAV